MTTSSAVNRQTVLVVDDEKINRRVLSDLLKDVYHVIVAKNGIQAFDKAVNHLPDLILLDILMPDWSGYEVLRRLKEDPCTQDIPVIFISALNTYIQEERGLRLGASDYITKPFRLPLVKARVDNHMQMVRQRKLLEKLVNQDCLTNICNRRYFEEKLQTEWGRAQRFQTQLSLAMIDVDHFKQYNDRYGHGGGDNVLRALADSMSGLVRRPTDTLARYGGEEFVILLPDTDKAGALALLNSMVAKIHALGIVHECSATHAQVTISVGGVTLMPSVGMNARSLVDLADAAMYAAKSQGRNRIVWND